MSVLLTSPHSLSLEDWAAQVRTDLSDDNIPEFFPGMDWQEWGRRCLDESSFGRRGAPAPEFFSDWREWADRVFQTLS